MISFCFSFRIRLGQTTSSAGFLAVQSMKMRLKFIFRILSLVVLAQFGAGTALTSKSAHNFSLPSNLASGGPRNLRTGQPGHGKDLRRGTRIWPAMIWSRPPTSCKEIYIIYLFVFWFQKGESELEFKSFHFRHKYLGNTRFLSICASAFRICRKSQKERRVPQVPGDDVQQAVREFRLRQSDGRPQTVTSHLQDRRRIHTALRSLSLAGQSEKLPEPQRKAQQRIPLPDRNPRVYSLHRIKH